MHLCFCLRTRVLVLEAEVEVLVDSHFLLIYLVQFFGKSFLQKISCESKRVFGDPIFGQGLHTYSVSKLALNLVRLQKVV